MDENKDLIDEIRKHDVMLTEVNSDLKESPNDIDLLRKKGAMLEYKAYNIYYLRKIVLKYSDAKAAAAREERDKLLKDAIRIYELILEISPNHTESYIDLAECWSSLEDYSKAIEYYDKAIGLYNKGYYSECLEDELKDAISRKKEILKLEI